MAKTKTSSRGEPRDKGSLRRSAEKKSEREERGSDPDELRDHAIEAKHAPAPSGSAPDRAAPAWAGLVPLVIVLGLITLAIALQFVMD